MKRKLQVFVCLAVMISFHAVQAEQPKYSSDWYKLIDGTYEGHLLSNNKKNKVVSTFKYSGNDKVMGVYEFDDEGKNEKGKFTNCQADQKGSLLCGWRDKYGVGILKITFTNSLNEFNGFWGEEKIEPEWYWGGKLK
ncbi:MAG: hypothetical protein V7776_12365 [Halopseudomonas aestusnigri]